MLVTLFNNNNNDERILCRVALFMFPLSLSLSEKKRKRRERCDERVSKTAVSFSRAPRGRDFCSFFFAKREVKSRRGINIEVLMEKKNNAKSLLHTFFFSLSLSRIESNGPAMSTTRGGREREREERTKRRKSALSSEEEGGETSSDDDDEEEDEEEEEEELENESESEQGVDDAKKGRRRRKKGGRGKLPSKETIRNAFEELCRCDDEAGGKKEGFTLQNLLHLCAKYGYHDWTLAEIENMLDAYDLSEARGEKKSSIVTERGFLEIVRKCGVREL